MNNNRNNNNRRRGRGNNRQQGGGNQNRVDSRARGNAPQMLDKYKKLAQDAAHNGDRVQAEYYLQFADHYFRVLADNKLRQDEARGGGNRRDNADDDDGDEDDFDSMRQNEGRHHQGGQNDGRQNEGRQNEGRQNEGRQNQGGQNQGGRNDRPNDRGGDRNDRQRGRNRRDDSDDSRAPTDGNDEGDNGGDFDPRGNPFVRGNRERSRPQDSDSPKAAAKAAPRDDARDSDGETRKPRTRRAAASRTESPTNDAGEIDAAVLPPSISGNDASPEAAEKPKRKLPPRRPRPAADETGDDGENLKAVG